jgi:hypothetical protein
MRLGNAAIINPDLFRKRLTWQCPMISKGQVRNIGGDNTKPPSSPSHCSWLSGRRTAAARSLPSSSL